MKKNIKLAVAVLATVFCVDAARTKASIYLNVGRETRVAPLDGSGPVEIIIPTSHDPNGIDVDLVNGKIYYGNGTDGIWQADLDGSNAMQIVTVPGISAHGVAVDVDGGKVYWTNTSVPGYVASANLDGTDFVKLAEFTGNTQGLGIELDPAGGKVYWSTIFSGNDGVWSANLDGSDPTVITTDATSSIDDIALDLVNGKIYWSNFLDIRMTNLDGSGGTTIVADGFTWIPSIDVDPVGGHLYYSGTGSDFTGRVGRMNLDGSGHSVLYSGAADVGIIPYGLSVATVIPEPATLTLLLFGIVGLRRRRRSVNRQANDRLEA
ncbi:MAG: DUF5050 domain-containing protein [Phycisphaerales bacterium]|nr:DUF5050 domain-containing protein [Phycisphaerales bacterium]